MSYLYVCEQGATIGITENRFQVKYKDGMVKSIPAETLEVIEIFGKIQITTQCITECLKRGVNILFYSTKGAYFGRLISTNHVNVQRQRLQAAETACHKIAEKGPSRVNPLLVPLMISNMDFAKICEKSGSGYSACSD